jgi:hypothetical protein
MSVSAVAAACLTQSPMAGFGALVAPVDVGYVLCAARRRPLRRGSSRAWACLPSRAPVVVGVSGVEESAGTGDVGADGLAAQLTRMALLVPAEPDLAETLRVAMDAAVVNIPGAEHAGQPNIEFFRVGRTVIRRTGIRVVDGPAGR